MSNKLKVPKVCPKDSCGEVPRVPKVFINGK